MVLFLNMEREEKFVQLPTEEILKICESRGWFVDHESNDAIKTEENKEVIRKLLNKIEVPEEAKTLFLENPDALEVFYDFFTEKGQTRFNGAFINIIRQNLEFEKIRGDNTINSAEATQREKDNKLPTIDELRMGVFIEYIESPVRDAVITLRRKGWETKQSGYYGAHGKGYQFFDIKDEEKDLIAHEKEITLIKEELKEKGITLVERERENDRVVIIFETEPFRAMSHEEWKFILDTFADAMPDLGHLANTEITKHTWSLDFVQRYLNKISPEEQKIFINSLSQEDAKFLMVRQNLK